MSGRVCSVNIHECVVEFDRTVRESRMKAEQALKKIPEIERMIQDAEDKTREARENLAGAEKDAQDALDIATEAQNTAQNADKVHTLIMLLVISVCRTVNIAWV